MREKEKVKGGGSREEPRVSKGHKHWRTFVLSFLSRFFRWLKALNSTLFFRSSVKVDWTPVSIFLRRNDLLSAAASL